MTDDSLATVLDDLPDQLESLDQALSSVDEEMVSLSELDGLLAAVCVCPEPIPVEEWLPLIWVGEDVDEAALLADPKVPEVVAKILQRQLAVAGELADDDVYQPIYPTDGDDVLWEVWLDGFEQGMSLRPGAWEALHAAGGEAAQAFELLTTLIFLAEGDEETKAELGPQKVEELMSAAPDVLAECVEIFARAERHRPVRNAKIGRNEPCPCGSGKKFKKCCAAG